MRSFVCTAVIAFFLAAASASAAPFPLTVAASEVTDNVAYTYTTESDLSGLGKAEFALNAPGPGVGPSHIRGQLRSDRVGGHAHYIWLCCERAQCSHHRGSLGLQRNEFVLVYRPKRFGHRKRHESPPPAWRRMWLGRWIGMDLWRPPARSDADKACRTREGLLTALRSFGTSLCASALIVAPEEIHRSHRWQLHLHPFCRWGPRYAVGDLIAWLEQRRFGNMSEAPVRVGSLANCLSNSPNDTICSRGSFALETTPGRLSSRT